MDSMRIPNGFPLPIQIHATHTANSRHANHRVETSIHSSSSVIAEPGIEWMEDFDFTSDVPCADPSHEHPADVRIACRCPKCGTLGEAVCWYWWARLTTEWPLTHVPCGTGIPMGSLRIVEVLR